jgi:Tfp pilus assembly protein PilO
MKWRAADYAFITALLCVSGTYIQFVFLPASRALGSRVERLRSTQAKILKSDDYARGLDDLERYLVEFGDAIAELDRLVPERLDGDGRLREISRVAKECGLVARSIRPDAATLRGAVTAHPLTIHVTGRYEQVLRFLFAAESLARHTRVTLVTIEQDGDLPGALKAKIELTSYSVERMEAGTS